MTDGKKTRQETIDELTLALLYLTRFNDREGSRFNEIAWKNYDFDSIERLDAEEYIIDPNKWQKTKEKDIWTKRRRKYIRSILLSLMLPDCHITTTRTASMCALKWSI